MPPDAEKSSDCMQLPSSIESLQMDPFPFKLELLTRLLLEASPPPNAENWIGTLSMDFSKIARLDSDQDGASTGQRIT